MDNYENRDFLPEEDGAPSGQQTSAEEYEYRGGGTGRKESPFANSPYEMNHEPRTDRGYHPHYEPPKKHKKKNRPSGAGKKVLAALLAVALVAGSCGITAALVNEYWDERTEAMEESFAKQIRDLQAQIDAASAPATGNSVSGTVVANGSGMTPSQVYAQNVRSVVLITCEVTGNYYGQSVNGQSSGSGFVMTADGYVMTNAHVIEGASKVTVTTFDGNSYPATVCGTDSINDVAVLKVEATDLEAAVIGSSDRLIVGDQVVAIGNPLGDLTSTMTVGYVSAKDRDVTTDGTTINMIQTDAAINSGNSGGPLFNMNGEVVGITTAKYSGSSASGATIEGIGFAIPIDDVMALVDDLVEFGYVKGAYMGVTIQDMDAQTASMAKVYGLPVGPIIVSTEPGGAAEKAGILPNDIVTQIGDTEISTVSELTRKLREFKPGDTTAISVYRNRDILDLTITFGERPASAENPVQTQPTVPEEYYSGEGSIEDWLNPFFGWGD